MEKKEDIKANTIQNIKQWIVMGTLLTLLTILTIVVGSILK